MKPVHYNDVLATVAYAAGLAHDTRRPALRQLLSDADMADRFVEETGQAHPKLGDGTLLSAIPCDASKGDASFRTRHSLSVWIDVLTALRNRMGQPDAQLMQRVTVGSKARRLAGMSTPQSSQ